MLWSQSVYVLVLIRILIFQFCPGFGSEASVSAVSWYRFCYLCCGSTSWYQGFGNGFSGGYLHLSNFGTGSVPFRFQFGSKWNLKLWYWNLNWLESKWLKFFCTKLQMLRFFRYFQFETNTSRYLKVCLISVSKLIKHINVIWVSLNL